MTRRISVRRSAGGEGRRPFSSSFTRTNRSIGLSAQPSGIGLGRASGLRRLDVGERAERPPGGVGPGLLLDHVVLRPRPPPRRSSAGARRPAPADSGSPFLGISGRSSGPAAVTSSSSPLSSGWPGTTWAPAFRSSNVASESFPFAIAGLVAADAMLLEDRRHVAAEVDRSVGHGGRGHRATSVNVRTRSEPAAIHGEVPGGGARCRPSWGQPRLS